MSTKIEKLDLAVDAVKDTAAQKQQLEAMTDTILTRIDQLDQAVSTVKETTGQRMDCIENSVGRLETLLAHVLEVQLRHIEHCDRMREPDPSLCHSESPAARRGSGAARDLAASRPVTPHDLSVSPHLDPLEHPLQRLHMDDIVKPGPNPSPASNVVPATPSPLAPQQRDDRGGASPTPSGNAGSEVPRSPQPPVIETPAIIPPDSYTWTAAAELGRSPHPVVTRSPEPARQTSAKQGKKGESPCKAPDVPAEKPSGRARPANSHAVRPAPSGRPASAVAAHNDATSRPTRAIRGASPPPETSCTGPSLRPAVPPLVQRTPHTGSSTATATRILSLPTDHFSKQHFPHGRASVPAPARRSESPGGRSQRPPGSIRSPRPSPREVVRVVSPAKPTGCWGSAREAQQLDTLQNLASGQSLGREPSRSLREGSPVDRMLLARPASPPTVGVIHRVPVRSASQQLTPRLPNT